MKGDLSQSSHRTAQIEFALALIGSAALVKAAAKIDPAFWIMPLAEVEAEVAPSRVGVKLSDALWQAMCGSNSSGSRTSIRALCQLAECSYVHGHSLLTKKPAFLAWALRSIVERGEKIGPPLCSDAIKQMVKVLSLPLEDTNGEPHYKNINLVLRAAGVVLVIGSMKSIQ